MGRWTAFPHAGDFPFDAERVAREWDRLHAGDAEPLPRDPAVLRAWTLCHRGEFEAAAEAGLAAGGDGVTVASKAMTVQATYLEPREGASLDLLLEVAAQAERQAREQPENASAWYWQAIALGRYSQGISVAKALAQGLAGKVKAGLEKTIALRPHHADAHIALGTFHAEVIDKVGALIGGMTYGANRDTGVRLLREGLRLHPRSPVGLLEAANGLLMLEGDAARDEAARLWEAAAATVPVDAIERLHVDRARLELAD
ncbi:hypothetical protein ACT80S_15125 [Ramlibacter sp. MAHUQ-53]|uniref:hypothetical protein n=1 Tax=unclassified Ramlibacter TaxID=2617605 RepID=UPI00363BC6C8